MPSRFIIQRGNNIVVCLQFLQSPRGIFYQSSLVTDFSKALKKKVDEEIDWNFQAFIHFSTTRKLKHIKNHYIVLGHFSHMQKQHETLVDTLNCYQEGWYSHQNTNSVILNSSGHLTGIPPRIKTLNSTSSWSFPSLRVCVLWHTTSSSPVGICENTCANWISLWILHFIYLQAKKLPDCSFMKSMLDRIHIWLCHKSCPQTQLFTNSTNHLQSI